MIQNCYNHLTEIELISKKAQHADPWLSELISYILSGEKQSSLSHLSSKDKNWVLNVSKHCKLEDGLMYYYDRYKEDPSHFRTFVPNDTDLQRHMLKVYLLVCIEVMILLMHVCLEIYTGET